VVKINGQIHRLHAPTVPFIYLIFRLPHIACALRRRCLNHRTHRGRNCRPAAVHAVHATPALRAIGFPRHKISSRSAAGQQRFVWTKDGTDMSSSRRAHSGSEQTIRSLKMHARAAKRLYLRSGSTGLR